MLAMSPLPTLVAAGAINAGFAPPMKFMRKWSWENAWLVWSIFGLLVVAGFAISCVQHGW
jgi:cyanate permease